MATKRPCRKRCQRHPAADWAAADHHACGDERVAAETKVSGLWPRPGRSSRGARNRRFQTVAWLGIPYAVAGREPAMKAPQDRRREPRADTRSYGSHVLKGELIERELPIPDIWRPDTSEQKLPCLCTFTAAATLTAPGRLVVTDGAPLQVVVVTFPPIGADGWFLHPHCLPATRRTTPETSVRWIRSKRSNGAEEHRQVRRATGQCDPVGLGRSAKRHAIYALSPRKTYSKKQSSKQLPGIPNPAAAPTSPQNRFSTTCWLPMHSPMQRRRRFMSSCT